MPLNFPTSPSDGDIYTDDNSVVWQYSSTKTVWNVVTGTTLKVFSGTKLGVTANVAVTTTSTAVSWDVESYDQGGYFSSGNATRITAPGSGFYLVTTTLFAGSQGSGYSVAVKKNGTTNLATSIFNANQTATYEEVIELAKDDYIEVYISEIDGTGTLLTSSFIEVTQMGLTVGTGISSYSAFSGAKAYLTAPFSTSSTPTATAWNATEYDTNANALGLTYWSIGTPARLTVQVSGYYNVDIFLRTGTAGGTYTVTLKKNGSTDLVSSTMAANESASYEQTYYLTANDYLELFASDTDSTGSLTTATHFEIIRMGY